MKRYYYHVSYYRSGGKTQGVGDIVIDTPGPIKTAEHINLVRKAIEDDFKEVTLVVILGFTLLRVGTPSPRK